MELFARAEASPRSSSWSDFSPILVFGNSQAACDRGALAVAIAGHRLAAALMVGNAIARLDQQAAASAVWIELDGDDGASLDRLLERVDRDAAAGRYAAIVATDAALIDPVEARLSSGAVEVLVDGSPIERTAALALALNGRRRSRLSDIAGDNSAARLRQLSDEVGRIAASLASLSDAPKGFVPTGVPASPPVANIDPLPDLSRDQLRAVIRARRARDRYFAGDLFADPAWDMLLDLMHAELSQIRVPVSSLCIAAAVPATTALRWIKTLADRGLIVRRADPHDGRRVFVELSNGASDSIRRYFGEVGQTVNGV